MNELDELVAQAQAAFAQASTAADLENVKAGFLGKTGRITELMKGMAALSIEEKKTRGAAINLAKQAIENALIPAGKPWQTKPCRHNLKPKPWT